jgi:hypothetical protein
MPMGQAYLGRTQIQVGFNILLSGISIITSSRIVSSWKKYQDKLIDLETFEAEIEESDD